MIIALDMDGTLLNSDGQISKRNKEAIIQAQRGGHLVAIATGRAYKDAYLPLQRAGIVCPIISLNGASITLADGTIIDDIPLDKQKLVPVLEWVRQQHDLYCEIYTNKEVYVGLHNREHLEALADRVGEEYPDLKRIVQKQFQQARVTYVDDIQEVWLQKDIVFYKVLVFSLNKDILKTAASKFAEVSNVTVTSSHPNNIEINHEQATKGRSLAKLASHYNNNMKDTVAIGDSHNDLSMFAVAGYRVAMGNAASELKEHSDFVTATNDEDGVALVLEKLLLQ
ncbi:Cof-type HAD-IIB family hydrolase [Thermaerobacillus caldiproteolyticus]|uniref:Cof-type HAD-IIB family hydrolase n=1 Tax=Thermaerobacillus caldiproteolyticus TaxID=247480 RepID=UPI00188BA7BE|nr:Cof-type HAD-IIB family hydrolase [Anoxybacillus caldiproteolyticus]QPA32895.1 HAD family phosphatase [Anoxybacillus caldiproteolyticus]